MLSESPATMSWHILELQVEEVEGKSTSPWKLAHYEIDSGFALVNTVINIQVL
jgi:hypothetical protein